MNRLVAVCILAGALSGCAHHKRAAHRSVPPPPAPRAYVPIPGATETGIASWYGHPYDGRPAADGEIYNMDTLVAAHRTLPFNTRVHVVNLDNSKSVDVRIIDRGPFVDGRIIDLSHAAAQAIGMIGPGTANVEIVVTSVPDVVTPASFAVQVGAFRVKVNAERLRAEMAARYGTARLVQRADTPGIWRVMVGAETTPDGAQALASRIEKESGEKNAFVVRLDS